jgi:hypothetical protein
VPHLRLPRLRRDGPSRALRSRSPNAELGVRGVLGKGRAGAALLSGMPPDFWLFPRQPLPAQGQSRASAPQCGLRPGRCPSLLTLLCTIPRSQWSPAPPPEEEDGHSAAQNPECRRCEIHHCGVPARREMLEVLQYPGVNPKAPNDPNGAPVQPVSRHCDRAGPRIGREMLKRAGEAGSHNVFRRQQRQKTEKTDANPRQEPKRCSEETGAHGRRLSELDGFGKLSPADVTLDGSLRRYSKCETSGSARFRTAPGAGARQSTPQLRPRWRTD